MLGAFHLGQPGMGSLLLVAAGPVAIYLIGGLVILAFREGDYWAVVGFARDRAGSRRLS